MIKAWKAARTSASFTQRSFVAPKWFVSAQPSRYDEPAQSAKSKKSRLTPPKGGEGCGGGKANSAASGAARA